MADREQMNVDANERPFESEDDVEVVSLEPVAPRLASIVSVRFDADTAHLVRRAARAQSQSQSEFIRTAAEQAARRVLRGEVPVLTNPPHREVDFVVFSAAGVLAGQAKTTSDYRPEDATPPALKKPQVTRSAAALEPESAVAV